MSVQEKAMLGRFLILAPPRFIGTYIEDAYDFLIFCVDRLHNLGLGETRGIDYTIFQVDMAA